MDRNDRFWALGSLLVSFTFIISCNTTDLCEILSILFFSDGNWREMSRSFTQGHVEGKCGRRIQIQNSLAPKKVAPWLQCHSSSFGCSPGRLLNICLLIDKSRQNHLTPPKLPAIEPGSREQEGKKENKKKVFHRRTGKRGHSGGLNLIKGRMLISNDNNNNEK